MTEHLRYIQYASNRPFAALKNEFIRKRGRQNNSTDRNSQERSLLTSQMTMVREISYVIQGEKHKYHYIFVQSEDSSDYSRVGWVLSDDAKQCMVCFTSFPLLMPRKHHCRACGNVICKKCSPEFVEIEGLESLGPLRCCVQCYFGQNAVSYVPNHQIGDILWSIDEINACDPFTIPITNDNYDLIKINLWEFGRMDICQIKPGIVLRTRRPNQSHVYINICTCPQIPYNDDTTYRFQAEKLINMICGSIGTTVKGASVYDIAVHPQVLQEALANPNNESKEQVGLLYLCQQTLICLSLFTSENDFTQYILDSTVVGNYMMRKDQTNTSTNPSETPSQRRSSLRLSTIDEEDTRISFMDSLTIDPNFVSYLAIPSIKAIQFLHQLSTKLEDAMRPEPISLQDSMQDKEQRLRAYATLHNQRIRAKLLGRTMEQLMVLDANAPSDDRIRIKELTPYPGFVIKTRRIMSDDMSMKQPYKKVFINVYHHADIDRVLDRANIVLRPEEEPFIAIGELTDVSDKEGILSLCYHIVISPKYFQETYISSPNRITDADYIQRILQQLNTHYLDTLDIQHFALPRIKCGYKGEWIQSMSFTYVFPTRTPEEIQEIRQEKLSRPKPVDVTSMEGFATPNMISDQTSVEGKAMTPWRKMLPRGSITSNKPTVVGMPPRSSISLGETSFETESVISDLTTDSFITRIKHKSVRKSILQAFNAEDLYAGQRLLTKEMMIFQPKKVLCLSDILELKEASALKPDILLGWQIRLPNEVVGSETLQDTIYVITYARKNNLRKVEYCLSSLLSKDKWMTLKRADHKSGISFLPLRKVLYLDDDKAIPMPHEIIEAFEKPVVTSIKK